MLGWVSWFNTVRLLEPIGYIPPVEYEQCFHQNQQASVMATGVNYRSPENPGRFPRFP